MLRSHHLRLYSKTHRKLMRSVAAEYLGRYVPGEYRHRFKLLYGAKHVVLLTKLLIDNKLVVFLTSLHCTFMLHTQRGCLNSTLNIDSHSCHVVKLS